MPPVAILAGGLATRLGEMTKTIPKSLLDVAGRPFIEHQLALLQTAGVRQVVLCLGHLGEQVQALLGSSHEGIELAYSFDGGELRGTGGALKRALPLLGEKFLVLYGDSYLRCDYAAIANAFIDSGKRGLMTVYKNDGQFDASNVDFAGGKITRYAKGVPGMTHIDYGLGGFHADAFARFDGKFDLVAVYQALLVADDLFGYEIRERFYEIGSVSGLEETRRLLETT
jgi:NDP-sugar pyrophosphorylase family protein